MAYIDPATLVQVEGNTMKVEETVIDLGTPGTWTSPLYLDLKLGKPLIGIPVKEITVRSTDTILSTWKDTWDAAHEEITISTLNYWEQSKKACTLCQFYCPVKPGNRYLMIASDRILEKIEIIRAYPSVVRLYNKQIIAEYKAKYEAENTVNDIDDEDDDDDE